MAFRSVNLNPPRGPKGGGGPGRGGGGRGSGSGYNTPIRMDPSGRVDQGFGPVGGQSTDSDFDIFGIDDPSTFQNTQQPPPQILYVSPPLLWSFLRSVEYYAFYHGNLDLERAMVPCIKRTGSDRDL